MMWTPRTCPVSLMEEQLEPARRVADDLAARDLAVVRHARLVGHAGRGELLLGTAHEGDLRDGVEPVREEPRHYRGLQAEGAGRGDAPLLHGHGGEAREADHVARGMDVGHRSAEASRPRGVDRGRPPPVPPPPA